MLWLNPVILGVFPCVNMRINVILIFISGESLRYIRPLLFCLPILGSYTCAEICIGFIIFIPSTAKCEKQPYR